MSDLISRQDAIEAVYQALRTPVPDYKNDFFHDSMSLAVNIVKNILSAEPERKTGEWKNVAFLTVVCSECGAQIQELEYDNFCPNCGAEMKRGE